jgi:mannose-6-phosphate isomerase-like protein (cupin superfamily)
MFKVALIASGVCFAVMESASAQVPGGCATPVEQRSSDVGCYLIASTDLGELPSVPLFWHVYVYPTSGAAEAARGPQGTVLEAFGKVWLHTIAEANWEAAGGEQLASIGPLPLDAGKQYTARYMEAVFIAGMRSSIHRHSGPEAWYIVSGTQCLETPEGIRLARANEGAVVPEGPPMALTSVGSETRRSITLVVHDTSQPWITEVSDWAPLGKCPE